MELRDIMVVLSEQFCSNKDLMGEEVDVSYADKEIP